MQFLIHNYLPNVIKNEHAINVKDRAFNYGDGCFTTMYAEGKTIFLLMRHIERLVRDAKRLGITIDATQLVANVDLLIKDDLPEHSNCVVKLIVTRGVGGRGYELPVDAKPAVHAVLTQGAKYSPNYSPNYSPKHSPKHSPSNCEAHYSYNIALCPFPIAQQSLLAGMKHLNRLEQIMAKQALTKLENTQDLIMLDASGNLVEATASNIFILVNDVWRTPLLNKAGVAGVMRAEILRYFENQGIPFQVSELSVEDLTQATSVFLCNALKFIIPVTSFLADKKIVYDTATPVSLAKVFYASVMANTQGDRR